MMRSNYLRLILLLCGLVCTLAGASASAADDIQVLKDVAYKSGELTEYERQRCQLDLYLPAAGKDFATVVWFHGGGLQGGDKGGDQVAKLAQRFTQAGIAVVSANYRLSPQVKYPAYIEDAAAAVGFVRKEIGQYGGSPQRIFISGHSAGGYLTAMLGLDETYLAKQGLKLSDIAGLMPVSGQMITHSTVREERGIPKTQPVIDEAAPAFHVSKESPPFLVIAGGRDLPTRAEENRYFAAAMQAAGHQQTTYLEVPERDHGTIASQIGKADDVVALAMLEFIKEHQATPEKTEHKSTSSSEADNTTAPPTAPTEGLPKFDPQRAVSPESQAYLEKLRKNTPFGTTDFNMESLRRGMGSRRAPKTEGVQISSVKVDDIPCEWVLAAGADPAVRLLYLHGGGWVSGSSGFYLTLAAHLSEAAKCAVLLPNYRLAPEHPFPAGLDDCVRAHEWMVSNGPAGPSPAKVTFVSGDSAGGNLTLATLLALRERKLKMPAGGIPLSASTDFTLTSESLQTAKDPIISSRTMPIFRQHYLGEQDPKNPLASPVFGDYHGIPPLLIQAGEHEMLRDDSIRVAAKAEADGAAVQLEIWPGMWHVFPSHEPLLPEGREAIARIAAFMHSLTPQ